MDSETPQTKEIDNKTDEGKAPENDQEEAKDTAIAGGTEGAQEGGGGGGHDNKSDGSDAAADMEEDAGDLVTTAIAGATIDDTNDSKGENGVGDSSLQAERDTDASEDVKKDEDTSESDAQKAQSEPETTEKVPLDMDEGETGEEKEKEKEEGLQYKVRFDVSGDSSTEAAGNETKVDPTAAAATDAEQGVSTPTKQPLPSTESGRKFLEPLLNFFQYCTQKKLGRVHYFSCKWE